MVDDQPKWRTGKICYIEIPAAEVAGSAEFYQRAFDWRMTTRGDGATSFGDTVGQVDGTFVTGRPPATEPGFGNILGIYQQPGLIEAEEKNQHG
jgi:predicted enzyme related to lactoylglutathione lyase